MGKRIEEPTPEKVLFLRALKQVKSAFHDAGLNPSTDKAADELAFQTTRRAEYVYLKELGRSQVNCAKIISDQFEENSALRERYYAMREGMEKLLNEVQNLSISSRAEVREKLDALIQLDEEQRLLDEKNAKRKDNH